MRILIILFGALALTACRGADAGSDETVQAERVVRSPGKPLHPVQVRAVVDGPVRAGAETSAKIVVTSARPAESVEVTLQPQLATVVSQSRFERRNGDLLRGKPVELPFRFRPASGEPQPIQVMVRVTGPDGRVLTREVTLSLSERDTVREPARKSRDIAVEKVPEPADDAIVPAQQEITRGD